MKTGIQLITEERARQINAEGWTPEHDDRHANHELQRAAESYLLSARYTLAGFRSFRPPVMWPWDKQWWKPSEPLRDFTKSGALWMAEIDRLKRLGESYHFPTILKNLANRVKQCAREIDQLNAKPSNVES